MFDKSPLQIRISGPDDEAKPLIDAVNSLLLPQKILIRAKLDGYGYFTAPDVSKNPART